MPVAPLLGPHFLRFLKELRTHNNRAWFQAHMDRYEAEVRDPFLRVIAALAPRLRTFDPPFIADPSPVGGSMMRIYRDIRFSRDKSPYKTAVAAHFHCGASKRAAAPALFLHLEPGRSVIGGGIWRPEPPTAWNVRRAIVGESDRWQRIISHRAFRSTFTLSGASLKRVPPEFDADHRFAVDLKRKDFILSSPLDDGALPSSAFLASVIARYKMALPF